MSGYEGGPQERFEEFLRTYKDEHGTLAYWSRIQRFSIDGVTSLNVDFQDLATFDNVVFSTLAKESPTQFLDMLDGVLRSVLRTEDPEYMEGLEESLIKIRIINYPTHVSLRAIRSRHIGKLIHISGIMMRASEVKPLLVHATFKCRRCGEIIYQPQEDGRYMEPDQCPVCGKKTPVRLIPEESKFRDWQKVRIQESPDELPPGSMPRSVDVILEGDIVDISRPGDFVKVTGLLLTTPDFTRRGGKLATFNVYIQANGVEITEKEYEQVELSEADEKEIRALAEDPYVHERIYASIAPSIKGHENIKESIALLLFGGVGKTLPDGTRLRGKSNILMIGDPGTGKSQILKFVSNLASRSLYTSGKGTSAAGLTAAVIHDTDTGAMTLEAGALVLADQGIACIDEFDKMDPNDRTAIHEAMEQQTVSVAKGGIVATLNARTSILAAANPSMGRYDPYRTVTDNISLPVTLLSRFDLIFILKDEPEKEQDARMSEHILSLHRGKTVTVEAVIPPELLRKYISYARRIKPVLSDDAVRSFHEFYLMMRSASEGADASSAITPRQLESLVRLSEARARACLRDVVTVEDAEGVISLMKKCLEQVGIDMSTGKYDIDIIMTGKPKTLRDKLLDVLSSISELEKDIGMVKQDDLLDHLERECGIDRNEAERLVSQLQREGTVYSPKPGFLKKT